MRLLARSWLVVPSVALASLAIVAVHTQSAARALPAAAAAAAVAAAIRAFSGTTAAGSAAAVIAALLATLGLVDASPRLALACAAGAFAIAELARPTEPGDSPYPAIGAAALAGALDPSFAALLAIAGVRFVRGPFRQPRGALAIPIAGALVIALAALLAASDATRTLWAGWTGEPLPAHRLGAGATHAMLALGDALGPLTATTALAGAVAIVLRGGHGAAAFVGALAGATVVSLSTTTAHATAFALAAIAAGVALARLAAMVRWPAAQACVGAGAGFLLVVALAMR